LTKREFFAIIWRITYPPETENQNMNTEANHDLRVLMFGWEFPPIKSGGLGTACFGLTRGLSQNGVKVRFVLPRVHRDHDGRYVELDGAFDRYAEHYEHLVKFTEINSAIQPYQTSEEYKEVLNQHSESRISRRTNEHVGTLYAGDLFGEVVRYGELAGEIALEGGFDVIHCHDWMTFRAAKKAKRISGKPMIAHVHATEFDRTGGNPNQSVYDLEREGMHEADHIITVSEYTKSIITQHYGVEADKITVLYNAVDEEDIYHGVKTQFGHGEKLVLFLGRITIQKGPDYFLKAAQKVLQFEPNTKFVIAGSGDMELRLIREAAEMGIGQHVLFTGFLDKEEVNRLLRMATVYVMPSVSEPFGIAPLEALANNTPVIISKQSGVSEVLNNCLKVDFWDIDALVNKMIAVIRYQPSLGEELTTQGRAEVSTMTWNNVGNKLRGIYQSVSATHLQSITISE